MTTMTETQTLRWRGERHPQQSSTLAVLMILDAVPDRDRWRTTHERLLGRLPRAAAIVREPAVPVGRPEWVTETGIHLDYHLRRVRLPGPGGMPELIEFAQQTAMTPFDRRRPLWEATLVEGLADGKAGYLLKVHRSLADEAGGLRLLLSPVLDDQMSAGSAAGQLFSAGTRALTHPRATVRGALRFAASLRHTSAPLAIPGSPLFRGRTGTAWRYGVLECRLADLEAVARRAGATVHDAYLAALLGGMRRYHERHGVAPGQMPMSIPVTVSRGRTVGAMFAGPAALHDPLERIATVHGIVLSLRVEPVLDALPALVPVLNRLPSAVGATAGRFLAHADLSAAYLPGSPHRTRLAGATVERIYPFGPLPGAAVMAAMISYAGVCCVGMNIDGSAVADPETLVGCMHEGFEEVLAPAR